LFPLLPSLTRNLMFVHCSNSSSNILAAAHQTHTDSNRCQSERDCHRSTVQLWNADMSTSSNHTKAVLPRQAHGSEFANLIVRPSICILDLTTLKVATAVVQTCKWSLCNKITFLNPSESAGLFNKFYALCCTLCLPYFDSL
jgi:hypothetical protein